MASNTNLYLFRSKQSPDLSCFCRDPKGVGLPEKFAPWAPLGVLRRDQEPPHGLSRKDIESGIDTSGFQLFRAKPRSKA